MDGKTKKCLIIFISITLFVVLWFIGKDDRKNPHPRALRDNQTADFIKNDISNKINVLSLKHGLVSSACINTLLKFYYYQNSNHVLDGDVPFPEMNSKIISDIAHKYDCPPAALAAVVSDYEAWVLAEDRHYRDDDPGALAPVIDRDEF